MKRKQPKREVVTAAGDIMGVTKTPPRCGNSRGHDTEGVTSMPDESSRAVSQRTGHPVSEPMEGEPDWVPRARELRSSGWTFKRVEAEVGKPHAVVHCWVAPNGDATKRNRPDHFTQTRNCAECGRAFKLSPSKLAAGRKYCSPECFHAKGRRTPGGTEAARQKMRAQRMGANNPAYRHGKYAGKKTKQTEKEFNLKKKGESACRNCGDDRPGINAHHAVPRSLSPAGRLDLRNCLPLCPACHRRWHTGTPISRDCFTADEWSFIETLIGPGWLDKRYPAPDGRWQFREGDAA